MYSNEWIADTMEPALGKGAIPVGSYALAISYSPKFKIPLPELLFVPDREGIRIHPGNSPSDTTGCILAGENSSRGELSKSVLAVNRVIDVISENDINKILIIQ
jgi:hypothetical protein